MENHSFELSYRRIKKNLDYLKNKSVDADKIKEINNVLFKIESSVKKINDLESELRQSYDRLNDVLTKSDELIDKKSKKGVDHSEVYQMPDETKLNDVNPGGASILVYCKNMNIGTSVARRLLKKKYEVLSVSELDNAIPIIQATSIDLCIFEIDDENIYIFEDFQNKIRNIHQSSKIPLILLISTDFSKQSHDLIARYPNIFDTIRKPVPPDMLEQKIELAFIQKHKNDHLEKATQRDRILTTQVNTDRLTKLYNRTFFEQEMMRMIKSNQHFYLVYADLDHFKPVNDSYGHVAGELPQD